LHGKEGNKNAEKFIYGKITGGKSVHTFCHFFYAFVQSLVGFLYYTQDVAAVKLLFLCGSSEKQGGCKHYRVSLPLLLVQLLCLMPTLHALFCVLPFGFYLSRTLRSSLISSPLERR